MESVEPPDTILCAVSNCHAARRVAAGSIPGWLSKR